MIETTEREKGVIQHLQSKLVQSRILAAQAEQAMREYVVEVLGAHGQESGGGWNITAEFNLEPANGATPIPLNRKVRREMERKHGNSKAAR